MLANSSTKDFIWQITRCRFAMYLEKSSEIGSFNCTDTMNYNVTHFSLFSRCFACFKGHPYQNFICRWILVREQVGTRKTVGSFLKVTPSKWKVRHMMSPVYPLQKLMNKSSILYLTVSMIQNTVSDHHCLFVHRPSKPAKRAMTWLGYENLSLESSTHEQRQLH